MNWENFISAMIGAVVGGFLSLFGTWLANYLQQAAARRELKYSRMKERFDEVRQYMGSALRLSELIARFFTYHESTRDIETQFTQVFHTHLERWLTHTVSPATWCLYVTDTQTLALLDELRHHAEGFAEFARDAYERRREVNADHVRDKERRMKEVAAEINSRLDAMLDNI